MEEVDKMNIDTGFLTVNLLEVNYIDMMKEMYDLSNLTKDEERNALFPYEWDLIKDNNVYKTVVYLLDNHNYLGKTKIVSSSNDTLKQIKMALETLIVGKNESKLPSGFRAIIPSDTTIKSIKLNNKIVKVDFSKEFLDVDEKNEEKIVEAVV